MKLAANLLSLASLAASVSALVPLLSPSLVASLPSLTLPFPFISYTTCQVDCMTQAAASSGCGTD
jgi:hypothetical protein